MKQHFNFIEGLSYIPIARGVLPRFYGHFKEAP